MSGRLLLRLRMDCTSGMVMPYWLLNTLGTFICFIILVFKPSIGLFVVVYFDDIL